MKQTLDVYLQLACVVENSTVKDILIAICTRLNNVSTYYSVESRMPNYC